MTPNDDASDPLVIQPWIQHIGRQINTFQPNKSNPGRGRWTGLRRHGLDWTVGPPSRDRAGLRRTWNCRFLTEYRSTNRTALQIDDWIPKRIIIITGATTTPVTRCKRRAVTKSEMSLCRLTNPQSYLVHVDPHAAGIRASEYATRQFEKTEWSRTDKSRVQFLQCGKRRERDAIFLFSSQDG